MSDGKTFALVDTKTRNWLALVDIMKLAYRSRDIHRQFRNTQ